MSKFVLVVELSTGPQSFTNSNDYADFINSIANTNPHLMNIIEYNNDLKSTDSLLLQNITVNTEDQKVVTSKTFATEEAASSYKTWLTAGEGKVLLDNFLDPLNWSVLSSNITSISDERYAEILLEA